jgi:hypothetical protein
MAFMISLLGTLAGRPPGLGGWDEGLQEGPLLVG